MAMAICGGYPILHDDTVKLKGLLVFADQYFRCKVVDIKLSWVFFMDMSNLITDTVVYIIESKLTKLKDK